MAFKQPTNKVKLDRFARDVETFRRLIGFDAEDLGLAGSIEKRSLFAYPVVHYSWLMEDRYGEREQDDFFYGLMVDRAAEEFYKYIHGESSDLNTATDREEFIGKFDEFVNKVYEHGAAEKLLAASKTDIDKRVLNFGKIFAQYFFVGKDQKKMAAEEAHYFYNDWLKFHMMADSFVEKHLR